MATGLLNGRADRFPFVYLRALRGLWFLSARAPLPENVLYFAQQRAPLRLVFHLRNPVEFLQQFALTFAQLARRLHSDFDEQIAFAAAIEHGYTFAANAQGGARLRSLGHFQRVFAFQCRDGNFRAQCCLGKRNGNHAVQVVPFAFKKGMFFDVQHDIKIARRTAVKTSFAQSGKTDARSVFDSGRNFRVHRSLSQDPSFAFAFGARIGNHATRALACRTSACDAEEPLLITHLPAPGAGAAGHRCFARSGAGASAVFAGFMAPDRDLGLGAEDSLLELKGNILTQISAALSTAAPAGT